MHCRGLCPRKPLPAEPGRGRGVFHRIFVGGASFGAFPFVDKICMNVDFICIYADKFVTL